jgi:hypothetical protein
MLEIIISPHLQDEMDILLQNITDTQMLFIEAKRDAITQDCVLQAIRYVDLLGSFFPARTVYANIVGSSIAQGCAVPATHVNKIKLVTFTHSPAGIRFS